MPPVGVTITLPVQAPVGRTSSVSKSRVAPRAGTMVASADGVAGAGENAGAGGQMPRVTATAGMASAPTAATAARRIGAGRLGSGFALGPGPARPTAPLERTSAL